MKNDWQTQVILQEGRREMAALRSGGHYDADGHWVVYFNPPPVTQERWETTRLSTLFCWSQLHAMDCITRDASGIEVLSESGFEKLYDMLPSETSRDRLHSA